MTETFATHRLLYAFYDLSVSPVSFDIIAFLAEADRVRREQGLDGIHVVVVPVASDGKRLEDLYSKTHETWRLDQIVAPACGLMPSVQGVTICASRDQAAPFLALGAWILTVGWFGFNVMSAQTLDKISGLVARRIVTWGAAGDRAEQGQRLGMIKFGSQVTLRLPVGSTVLVEAGQRVEAGTTVIARLPTPPC